MQNHLWERRKKRIGSLASNLGVFNFEFDELLATGNLSKFWSWYKKLGVSVQTHKDHSITCIAFYKAFTPLQWSHLPRHQIIWENTGPDWVCRPTCGWAEISIGEKIRLDARYLSSDLLVNRLVDWSAAEEVLKKMEYYAKRSRAGLQWGAVEHNIGKRELSLPKNCVLETKSQQKSI